MRNVFLVITSIEIYSFIYFLLQKGGVSHMEGMGLGFISG